MRQLDRLARWLHRHMVGVLLLSYGLATLVPEPGQRLRQLHLGDLQLGNTTLQVPLPTLLLALLLGAAAMGVDLRQLQATRRRPQLLLVALLTNVSLPLLFLAASAALLAPLCPPEQQRSLLVGLAILAAMPIAGSSTAWAQQAHGNLALSLGLVLCSTLLCPVLTPLCLHLTAWLTQHRYDAELVTLAGTQTQLFLWVAVLLPCAVGLGLRGLCGRRLTAWLSPLLRLGSLAVLVILSYSNAAIALPRLLQAPDWRYVVLCGLLALGLCVLRYGGGFLLGTWLRASPAEIASMTYGLGMNNNGSGLVLASQQMPHDANLLLLLVAYTLLQQLAAGAVQLALRQQRRRAAAAVVR